MFLRSCWYIAAISREVTRLAPLSRTLLNEKVVMFRTLDGAVSALEDRCPHRFAPLSAGRLEVNGISCGYHGMSFDRHGVCIANPTQPSENIPPQARVRTYPLVERHGVLWIWMGEASAANPDLIPDYEWCDHPQWDAGVDYLHVAANYLLMVDNLLDLTHINFIHGDVLGTPEAIASMTGKTEITEQGAIERWISPGCPPVPAWRAIVDEPWMTGNVDFWMDMGWERAGNLALEVGVTPAGSPRTAGCVIMTFHCVTPETATTSHYFSSNAQSYRSTDKSIISFWRQASKYAFQQDKRMLELVQANMGDSWDILTMKPTINKGDRSGLYARRQLRKLIDQERGSIGGKTDAPALQE